MASKSKLKMKMDFVTSDTLNKKSESKRVDFILNKVKDGTILVTDGVFKPEEEMDLIKETMRKVDSGFPGIEICSIKRPAKGMQSVFEKITDSKDQMQNFVNYLRGKESTASMRTGITLIGPARLIKKIKKNPNSFSVLTGGLAVSHKCVRCGNIYEDNDASILRGCKCGSIFFMYMGSDEDAQQIEKMQSELKQKDTSLEKELVKQIDKKTKTGYEYSKPEEYIKVEEPAKELKIPGKKKPKFRKAKFGIETVRVKKEGIYEINIDALMKDQPLVILERGSVYLIHLPSAFDKVKE